MEPPLPPSRINPFLFMCPHHPLLSPTILRPASSPSLHPHYLSFFLVSITYGSWQIDRSNKEKTGPAGSPPRARRPRRRHEPAENNHEETSGRGNSGPQETERAPEARPRGERFVRGAAFPEDCRLHLRVEDASATPESSLQFIHAMRRSAYLSICTRARTYVIYIFIY